MLRHFGVASNEITNLSAAELSFWSLALPEWTIRFRKICYLLFAICHCRGAASRALPEWTHQVPKNLLSAICICHCRGAASLALPNSSLYEIVRQPPRRP
jgi:hypothetical protein